MAMAARILTSISAACLLAAPALAEAPGGLDWGAPREAVAAAFAGVEPISEGAGFLSLPLTAVISQVKETGGFCPSTLCAHPLQDGAAATFSFGAAGLREVYVTFSRPFSDFVADMGLFTQIQRDRVARSEFQLMSAEFAARYGRPAVISDADRQYDDVVVVGGATYLAEDGGAVAISIGARGNALVGDIWYLPPGAKGGF